MKKSKAKLIESTLRPIKLRLCSAYRTVSNSCLDVISGFSPVHLQIEERMRRFGRLENFTYRSDIIHQWSESWVAAPTRDEGFKHLISDI